MLIEQAIFTSTQTERADGYQLVSQSPGLSAEDARELTVWGPSHDSLVERQGDRSSTNFFELASGAFCVSRTLLAGAEYSGRGEVVYTQFLIVPPEVLARFANNPFAILRAATASGDLRVHERIPKALVGLRLGGRAAAVDLALLAQLARDPGPRAMATLVQTALASARLAIAADISCDRLVAGLFSLLPVECRREFSFSTGLKFSPSRPLRLATLPDDRSSWSGIDRQGFTLLNLADAKLSGPLSWDGWAGCVAGVLASGKLSVLAGELEPSRPWLSCANLHLLSEQVQARWSFPTQEKLATGADLTGVAAGEAPLAAVPQGRIAQRADGAHIRRKRVLAAAQNHVAKSTVAELVEALAAQPPEVLEMLERIDDLVFTAIDGDDRSLGELQVLWPMVAAELNEDLVEQSREQYLRCALSIWTECVEGEVRRPERAVAAIDVLCVLFED